MRGLPWMVLAIIGGFYIELSETKYLYYRIVSMQVDMCYFDAMWHALIWWTLINWIHSGAVLHLYIETYWQFGEQWCSGSFVAHSDCTKSSITCIYNSCLYRGGKDISVTSNVNLISSNSYSPILPCIVYIVICFAETEKICLTISYTHLLWCKLQLKFC